MIKRILKYSAVVIGVISIIYLCLCGATAISLLRTGTKSDAPKEQASFEERKSWGINFYGLYWLRMEAWVKNSELIETDIGRVSDMAASGKGLINDCFTDGCFANMQLEVRGAKGVGLLKIFDLRIESDAIKDSQGKWIRKERIYVGNGRWIVNGHEEIIASSGKSYLRDLGIEADYKDLEIIYRKRDYAQFNASIGDLNRKLINQKYAEQKRLKKNMEDGLQSQIKSTSDPAQKTLLLQELDKIQKQTKEQPANYALFLPDLDRKYKRPLLIMSARAKTEAGDKENAMKMYEFAAEYFCPGPVGLEDVAVLRNLLHEAHAVDPSNETIEKLAFRLVLEERAIKYGYACLNRYEDGYDSDKWVEKEFSNLFVEAKKFIENSEKVKTKVGPNIISIKQPKDVVNFLTIDSEGYYNTVFIFEVPGQRGHKS